MKRMGHLPRGPREARGAQRIASAYRWARISCPDLLDDLGEVLIGIVLAAADRRQLNVAYVRERASTWR